MPLATNTFDQVLTKLLTRSGRAVNAPTLTDYPDVAAMLNLRLQEIWDYPGGGWDFLKVTARIDWTDQIRVDGFGVAELDGYYDENAAEVNGKAAYTLTGNITVEWDGTAWNIYNSSDAAVYTSTEDVLTPDLVVTWAATGAGTAPIGTVGVARYRTIDISSGQQVLGVFAADPREDPNAVPLRTSTLVGNELKVQADGLDQAWWVYYPEAPEWTVGGATPSVYRMFVSAAIELTYADMLLQKQNNKEGVASKVESAGYKRLNELCERYAIMQTTSRMQVRR